jgi:hypothetical protein
MAVDTMNEASHFRFEKYLNSNPYREYAMNKPYMPKSIAVPSHSNRLKSSFIAFHPLMNNQKDSSTLDRATYKLRMKSKLNVDTQRETPTPHRLPRRYYYQRQSHTNTSVNDKFSIITPSTKTLTRQPTALTRTTNSINTNVNGIEGNAVRVRTLNDLISQLPLIDNPTESSDNTSTFISTKPVINERITPKLSSFSSERIAKQPQALTEYHFDAPPSQTHRYRKKDEIVSPPLIDQYRQRFNSLERQATVISSHDKRIQESRDKISLHTEKQICICNKLTIIDPFNSEQNPLISPLLKKPSAIYIFPPLRPPGYFTRKPTDDSLRSTPKKKYGMKIKQQELSPDSLDSIDQISIDEDDDDDESLHVFNITNKSRASLIDVNDDLRNPPNTRVNVDLKKR